MSVRTTPPVPKLGSSAPAGATAAQPDPTHTTAADTTAATTAAWRVIGPPSRSLPDPASHHRTNTPAAHRRNPRPHGRNYACQRPAGRHGGYRVPPRFVTQPLAPAGGGVPPREQRSVHEPGRHA